MIHPIPSTPPIPELSTHIEEPLSHLFSDTREGEVIHAISTFNTPSLLTFLACSIPETCKSTTQVSLIGEDPHPSESDIISSIQHQTIGKKIWPMAGLVTQVIKLEKIEEKNKKHCPHISGRRVYQLIAEQGPDSQRNISWVQSGDCPKIQVNRTSAALVVLWKQFNLLFYKRGLLLRKRINTKDPDTPPSLIVVSSSRVPHRANYGDIPQECHELSPRRGQNSSPVQILLLLA